MSDNIYLVDIGINEDTIIYELVPKKLAQLKGYSLREIIERLKSYGARSLVVDSPNNYQVTDELKVNGFAVSSDLPTSLIVKEAKRG